MPALRPELDPLPVRMRDLPIDDRGYVVPWFVAWVDGKPEFRAMDKEKWRRAIKEKRCWVCGCTLGAHLVFVIGPMCGVNRVTSEPPNHLECARWSVRNCPFLTRPHMVRRENDLPGGMLESAGVAIMRNPGVTMLYATRSFSIFKTATGPLLSLGVPEWVEFWAEKRHATREEITESVRTGLPALMGMAELEGESAVKDLEIALYAFERLLPHGSHL